MLRCLSPRLLRGRFWEGPIRNQRFYRESLLWFLGCNRLFLRLFRRFYLLRLLLLFFDRLGLVLLLLLAFSSAFKSGRKRFDGVQQLHRRSFCNLLKLVATRWGELLILYLQIDRALFYLLGRGNRKLLERARLLVQLSRSFKLALSGLWKSFGFYQFKLRMGTFCKLQVYQNLQG